MTADRRAAWTFQLRDFWSFYNAEYLRGALRPPSFRLVRSRSTLGQWLAETREITISLPHLLEDPWVDVLATLRHEMAHQFADEVLRVEGETPHGPAFRRACERLRVASREDVPVGSGGGDDETERLAIRIAKLFALGASPNEHEATAAMRKARRLMIERNVDLVRRDVDREFACRPLGSVKSRHAAWETELGALLGEFYFVEAIWADAYDPRRDKRGTELHVYGTPENLRMAEYVHGYLIQVLGSLWEDYRRLHRAKGAAAKHAYFRGLLQGFRDKLREQQREIDTEARAAGALVWSGDPRLSEYFRWHHPRIETRLVGARRATEAYRHGCRDGRSISLRKPLEARGDAAEVRRISGG